MKKRTQDSLSNTPTASVPTVDAAVGSNKRPRTPQATRTAAAGDTSGVDAARAMTARRPLGQTFDASASAMPAPSNIVRHNEVLSVPVNAAVTQSADGAAGAGEVVAQSASAVISAGLVTEQATDGAARANRSAAGSAAAGVHAETVTAQGTDSAARADEAAAVTLHAGLIAAPMTGGAGRAGGAAAGSATGAMPATDSPATPRSLIGLPATGRIFPSVASSATGEHH